MTGPHAAFILAAYAIGVGVIGGLIVWTILDWRAQSKALAALEAKSGRRRASS